MSVNPITNTITINIDIGDEAPQVTDPDFDTKAPKSINDQRDSQGDANSSYAELNNFITDFNSRATEINQSVSDVNSDANRASQAADNAEEFANYYGEWSSGTTYNENNIVTLNAVTYYSKTDNNTGNNPETDSTNWGVYSRNSAMTEADFKANQEQNKSQYVASGFVEWGGTRIDRDVVDTGMFAIITSTSYTNILLLGTNVNDNPNEDISESKTPYAAVNLGGTIIDLRYGNTSSDRFDARFPDADSKKSERQDFVFPEKWTELISEKDFVYPRGLVQTQDTSYKGITLNTTGAPAASYSAFGAWDTTSPQGKGLRWSTMTQEQKQIFLSDPLNNIRLTENGLVQDRLRIRTIPAEHNGEWYNTDTSGYLQPEATSYVVAQGSSVSIAADISTTQADGFAGKDQIDTLENGEWYNASKECYAIPIATVQRLNQGAYDPLYNPAGTAKYSDSKDWWETSISRSEANCFISQVGGNLSSGVSGRPDGKYHDVIYADLVKDERNSSKLQNYTEVMEAMKRKLLNGTMRGWESEKVLTGSGVGVGYTDGDIQAETLLQCDIIGDPTGANYPSAGFAGVPNLTDVNDPSVSQLPADKALISGQYKTFRLSRKSNSIKKVYVDKTGTGTLVEYTLGSASTANQYSFNSTTNEISINQTASGANDSMIVYVMYETKAYALESDVNNEVLEFDKYAAAGCSYLENYWGALINNLLNKISTGNAAKRRQNKLLIEQYIEAGEVDKFFTSTDYEIINDTFSLSSVSQNQPACKFLFYLTKTDNQRLKIQVIFKEMIYDVSWGDNDQFEIADNVETFTDDNGNTGKRGQKSIPLPYFDNFKN